MIKIISNTDFNVSSLDRAIKFLSSHYKRNIRGMIHDEIRDFLITKLDVIKEGLKFVTKELRVEGGCVDIVAKDKEAFYFIELETMLSKNLSKDKRKGEQLIKQREGLQYVISTFTNKKVDIKLILVEYLRDKHIALVKTVSDTGNIENIKEVCLKGD